MNGQNSHIKITGFTIVELVVVIAVIGLLATIGTISYRSMQDKTNFSILNNDLKGMKAAIERHYAKNGSYPSTGDAWRFRARDGNEFIPGLYPNFQSFAGCYDWIKNEYYPEYICLSFEWYVLSLDSIRADTSLRIKPCAE